MDLVGRSMLVVLRESQNISDISDRQLQDKAEEVTARHLGAMCTMAMEYAKMQDKTNMDQVCMFVYYFLIRKQSAIPE